MSATPLPAVEILVETLNPKDQLRYTCLGVLLLVGVGRLSLVHLARFYTNLDRGLTTQTHQGRPTVRYADLSTQAPRSASPLAANTMKLSLATSIMLYRLVRGFAFTPSPSLNGSLRPILRTGEGESRTTPQQRRYTSGTDLTTSSMRTSSTRRPSAHVSKMVIRPDWEREGKAFGMEPPSKKTGERAFEYLVDYPCEFEIKVIGINEGSFADDIAATVSTACQVRLRFPSFALMAFS